MDFETDPFDGKHVPKAFAAGFYTSRGYSCIWGTEKDVIEWAQNKVSAFEGYVFAHNGGKFDFPAYLLKNCGKLIKGESALVINGRLVKMSFGKAEIRDSYAILPAPLSSYDKGNIDYAKLHKHVRRKHRVEIMDYLRRDCESLHRLVLDFVVVNGIKKHTAASAAMSSMVERCQSVDSLSESQDESFRRFYYGGRVQCFASGIQTGQFHVYDIKSAYPAAMVRDHGISNRFRFLPYPQPDRVKDTDFVCVECHARGCFPVRNKKGGLDYPNEHRKYYVTGWEYNMAKRLGLISAIVIQFIERPSKVGNFKDYVEYHYAEKERAEREGNLALRLIHKILINSGYGKLAQDPEKWREYIFVERDAVISEDGIKEGWQEELCDDGAGYAVWSRPSSRPKSYYNVSTAASITGCVRATMMEAIHKNEVVYCDTDSITVRGEAKGLDLGSQLGQWDLETQADLAMIGGKKLYGLRISPCPDIETIKKKKMPYENGRAWKMATKGCKLSPSELERVCKGETVEYNNEAPTISIKSDFTFVHRKIRMTA